MEGNGWWDGAVNYRAPRVLIGTLNNNDRYLARVRPGCDPEVDRHSVAAAPVCFGTFFKESAEDEKQ
jgi:hypothetical protein